MAKKNDLFAIFYVFAVLCLFASCAQTNQALRAELETTTREHIALTAQSQELTINLFGVDKKTDPERYVFYKDFTEKQILPLKIEIINPTNYTYSLADTQYAICDPDYNRVRRMQAQQMALSQVEITQEKQPSFLNKLLGFSKKRKLKKEFAAVEFQEKIIPPQSTIRGWLYFQLNDYSVIPQKIFEELKGYQLEIAHIKNLQTNVVTNVYFDLDAFFKTLE